MAQAGLHVPADARLAAAGVPVGVRRHRRRAVDRREPEHVLVRTSTNIVAMDRTLALPALVLLDEVGAGTDPIEGGALGIAIVDHFRQRGAHVVATTHYDALKTYASTTEGVDLRRVRVRPRDVRADLPADLRLARAAASRSRSPARLGLSPAVIDAARRNISARARRSWPSTWRRSTRDLRALEHERRLVDARARGARPSRKPGCRRASRPCATREERLRHRADEELEARVRAARREIDKVVDDLRREVDRLTAEASRRALHGTARVRPARPARRAPRRARRSTQVAERLRESRRAGAADRRPATARAARRRATASLVGGARARRASCIAVHGERRGGRRARQAAARAGCATCGCVGRRRPPRRAVARERQRRRCSRATASPTELNVIGCTVDEALARRRAVPRRRCCSPTSGRSALIHGYGTGQLRRAIGEFLQAAPAGGHASSPAPPEQGGGGRDGGGVEGLAMALFPQPSSTTCARRADIVQVIQEYVSLKKAGTTLQGTLPVPRREDAVVPRATARRGSSTASAAASAATSSSSSSCTRRSASPTRCGCWRSKFGMPVPESRRRTASEADAREREALLKIHEVAAACFREQLAAPAGARARQQLARPRHDGRRRIEPLGLGLRAAVAGRACRRTCCGQGFPPPLLAAERARRASATTGRSVDRFRNRLMIPIAATPARSSPSAAARWRRTSEPEVPELARDADLLEEPHALRPEPARRPRIRKSGFAVLVEGYFDFAQVLAGGAGAGGRHVRHGADAAAGAAAAALRVEGRPELRPGRGRPGRGGAVVRAAGRRRVRGERRRAARRARIPTPSSGSTGGDGVRATSCSSRSRIWSSCSTGRRPRTTCARDDGRRAFLQRDAGGRGADPGRGRARPVRRPARAQGADHRGGGAGRDPQGGRRAGGPR